MPADRPDRGGGEETGGTSGAKRTGGSSGSSSTGGSGPSATGGSGGSTGTGGSGPAPDAFLTVNGTKLPKFYELHCFPGSWGQIHAATTQLPLKAGGDNSIRVVATTGRDAADMDAIAIFPAGMGIKPMAFAH